MALGELIAAVRTDLADLEAQRFSDEVLRRCILKSVFPVARDLEVEMSIQGDEIAPEPTGEGAEMLLLHARIEACRFMRASTANAFSFSSGDKRVDKTSQPEHWARLEADLLATYRQRLGEIKGLIEDDYILRPGYIRPAIYEQGSDL